MPRCPDPSVSTQKLTVTTVQNISTPPTTRRDLSPSPTEPICFTAAISTSSRPSSNSSPPERLPPAQLQGFTLLWGLEEHLPSRLFRLQEVKDFTQLLLSLNLQFFPAFYFYKKKKGRRDGIYKGFHSNNEINVIS